MAEDNITPKITIRVGADSADTKKNIKEALEAARQEAYNFIADVNKKFSAINIFGDISKVKEQLGSLNQEVVSELTRLKDKVKELKLDTIVNLGMTEDKDVKNQIKEQTKQQLIEYQARIDILTNYQKELKIKNDQVILDREETIAREDAQYKREVKDFEDAVKAKEKLNRLEIENARRAAREQEYLRQNPPLTREQQLARLKALGEYEFEKNQPPPPPKPPSTIFGIPAENFGGAVLQGLGIGTGIGLVTQAISTLKNLIANFIELIKNATKASIEFGQAQYNLAIQVGASQRVLGVEQAGSLQQWQNKVASLRQELQIYSTKDVTQAVSQTAILTRVMGLNADKQTELIKIAGALARTTGTDLSQAVEDVTRALGGSSIVLDKYGLFIRQADKDQVSLEMGLGRNAKELTSEQLALVTLETILRQVNPLINTLGSSLSSTALELKKLSAQQEDDMIIIGKSFEDMTVKWERFKTALLDGGAAYVTMFNTLNEITPKWFKTLIEWNIKALAAFNPLYSILIKIDELMNQTSDRASKNVVPALTQYEKDRYYKGFGERDISQDNEPDIYRWEQEMGGYGIPKTLPQKQITDAGYDLSKIMKERMDRERQAFEKFTSDMRKLTDDWNKAKRDAETKYRDALLKLDEDTKNKQTDLLTNKNRSLRELELDDIDKKLKIELDFEEKSIKLKEDYYDKLKNLDLQYLFDLRDAVAENDAVAIKRLERKYNLEKAKLDDNLKDRQSELDISKDKEYFDLYDETEKRKKEIERRYQDELVDLQIYNERRKEDINDAHAQELDDIDASYKERSQIINDRFREQTEDIRFWLEEQIYNLGVKLAEDENLTEASYLEILRLTELYYGANGAITQAMKDGYELRKYYATSFLPLNNTGLFANPDSPTYIGGGYDLSNLQPRTQPTEIIISSDGSVVADLAADKVIDQISTQMMDALVRRQQRYGTID